jgi:hypothetical protein
MTELAFLRAFLAWEAFLAESFVLYIAGHRPPRGRTPKRYTFPPSLKTATDWVIPEGREYAEWTAVSAVITRAQRFFEHGGPYAEVLANNRNTLSESKIIRNAIAHASATAQEKFEKLVRDKIKNLPPHFSVGAFLGSTVPKSSPPQSFLEYYLGRIELAARRIVPT